VSGYERRTGNYSHFSDEPPDDPAPVLRDPLSVPDREEIMDVVFEGQAFRLIFRQYAARASLSCEVLADGTWHEMAGYRVGENEMKFHRGIEWLYRYARDHEPR
jgi:hypothetical protein